MTDSRKRATGLAHMTDKHRPTTSYLGRVQALRFFAAFAVLVGHLQHEVLIRVMPGVPFRTFTAIDGGIGVDMFFVISGFIMYYISGDAFGQPGGWRRFASRRFLRIAPLYYVATLSMLAAAAMFAKHVDSDAIGVIPAVASFFFLPLPNAAGAMAPVLKLGWTLNYEAYFYAIFMLALVFPKRIGLVVLFGVLLGIVGLAQLVPGRLPMLDFWGQPIVLEFAAGVILAMVYRAGWRIPTHQALALIAGGLVLTITLRHFGLSAYAPRAVAQGIPAALIVCAVVLWQAATSTGFLARLLEFGGNASYALYLSHPFSIRAATIIWGALGGPQSPWLFIAFTTVAALATAALVHIGIEKPLDRVLRHLFGRNRRDRLELNRSLSET
jgi:exopolysaccharide production protein ExoZ